LIQSSHRAYGSGRITSIGFTETSEAVKQITLSVPTETMDNLSETYQNTLPEIQVNPCRAHQKTKQIHAGTFRDFIKSMQTPSDFHQNPYITNQNLNDTYAGSTELGQKPIRISTKPCRTLLEIQQKPIRISTIPMQNPSESQQNHAESIRNSTKIHQNLNNTYAEPIRTSTKIHQNLNKTHA